MKMLLRQNIRLVNRCYSTISTQATISHVPRPSPIPTTTPRTTTTIKHRPETPQSIKEQIVELQRVESHFHNEHGVFNKIGLLVKNLRSPETPIRIGVLNAKKTFLNTILADPFASDQSWYEAVLSRPAGTLVRFTDRFEISGNTYNIPSPVLETNNIEILEIDQLDYNNDGCHLYLNFGGSIDSKWPTYEFQDEDSEILGSNEINSKLAFEGVNLLKKSPMNSTTYTKLYNSSNFQSFNSTFNKIISSDIVLSKLYKSIVKILQSQNISNSLTLKDLDLKDQSIKSYISQWDEAAHREFQTQFQPYINEFESKNLAWWKLYYKNDDIEAIMTEMLNNGFLNDSLKNYSYVKGQIDSFSSFKKSQKLNDISSELDQNALTALKNRVVQDELFQYQNDAVKMLLLNFGGLQLPVVLISLGGYFLYNFSLYSMFGLGSLGIVLGFNNVSKKWLKLMESFKMNLFENTRLAISETNQQLYQHWETKYESERQKILQRLELIEKLEQKTTQTTSK